VGDKGQLFQLSADFKKPANPVFHPATSRAEQSDTVKSKVPGKHQEMCCTFGWHGARH